MKKEIIAKVPLETSFYCPLTGKRVFHISDGDFIMSTEDTCVLWIHVSELAEDCINPLFTDKYEKLKGEFNLAEENGEDVDDFTNFVLAHKDCESCFKILLDSSEGPLVQWIEFLIDLELLNEQ